VESFPPHEINVNAATAKPIPAVLAFTFDRSANVLEVCGEIGWFMMRDSQSLV
jgi:hypothetical protein